MSKIKSPKVTRRTAVKIGGAAAVAAGAGVGAAPRRAAA